ncbi:1-acylglycerol-3-phosphate O-acyltransferase [Trifolium repens]|nr:1-acylglycerol-3-phosphate O-acyltransferase [Trifolium repens]
MLSTFKDPQDPLWLAIFPEGTDFTEEKCIRSEKYAAEHGKLLAEHCAKVESMLVGKWKVDGSGVGVDVSSCTNQSNFENEKSDQEKTSYW